MRAHVLLNPVARGGRNAAVRPALEAALRGAGITPAVHETAGPGDAERRARALSDGPADGLGGGLGGGEAVVLVAGGDGTVHEAVNGLAGSGATLGVLPLGTGNDFAHALGMADALPEAARQLARAPAVAVDLGRVRWTDGRGAHERLFANGLGAGFDAHAAALAAETKWLGGRAAYLAAVLRTLWAWRTPSVRARARTLAPDGPGPSGGGWAGDPLAFEGPLFLCEVGNGHSVGGGFHLTPDAVPHDGLLDVCLVRHLRPARALRLLPRTFAGRHVGLAEVTMARVPGLALELDGGAVALHGDGEALSRDAVRVEAEVLPGALRALAPALG